MKTQYLLAANYTKFTETVYIKRNRRKDVGIKGKKCWKG